MTTREKIAAVLEAFQATPSSELAPEVRDLVELVQIARGFGFDLAALLIPTTDAEADVLVDKAISMLLEIRGDDLPPFDSERYGEAASS